MNQPNNKNLPVAQGTAGNPVHFGETSYIHPEEGWEEEFDARFTRDEVGHIFELQVGEEIKNFIRSLLHQTEIDKGVDLKRAIEKVRNKNVDNTRYAVCEELKKELGL